MRIDVITLFPEMFQGPLTESILQRAQDEGHLELNFHNLREFGTGNYRQVDDSPYGGGAGMVITAEVGVNAIEAVVGSQMESGKWKMENGKLKPHIIYLSPRGERLEQEKVEQLAAKHEWLILLCGHYEGIDQRIIDGGWIDEEISIGDYVLTGGEIPAMVLVDAVARQIPGVLGKDESAEEESFSKALGRKREYPHYTRPEEFRGLKVPDVLLSGNHAEIDKWRIDNTK
ncbi:tRNA (guanosine(37)-N1)-methyltransferase TrmD [Patescibacteria group bacterium]|nr:tRNA (guanosine(37)-N1)-methyltransferase TrmD [Patescibacteria group bacterium]MBU1123976.1 tRNA (guanosine(37)-N1)-methyltransferase TrmD [Patescibacteria group bacterium]MBU1911831.1 tRNA (guanosine(37)-N1)-methyltransferase TrmD [Patescibacteria group bacterium]